MLQKVTLAVVVGLALSASGCYARVQTAEPAVAVDTYEYEPLYYNRHVVYYDTVGTPYYVIGGAIYCVPAPHRHHYVVHYQNHRPAYHRWHSRHAPAVNPHRRVTPKVHHRPARPHRHRH
jgi:hypothetical protein